MSRNGIAARKQAELKNRRIRNVGPGVPPIASASKLGTGERQTSVTGVLSRVIDTPSPAGPAPTVEIRTLDAGGRFRLETVTELGWEPGAVLAARFDGTWLMVTPGPAPDKASLRVTFDNKYRLGIPHGLRARLGVDPGHAVVVRLHPEESTVAVAPAELVVTALDLLDQVRSLPTIAVQSDRQPAAEVS